MSTLLTPARTWLMPWACLLAGLLAMFVPSFWDLFHGAWGSEKNAHGPIVMTVAFSFLFFRLRQMLRQQTLVAEPAPYVGYPLLLLGTLMFAIGRSQSVLLLE